MAMVVVQNNDDHDSYPVK